jgi:hypothetical protein
VTISERPRGGVRHWFSSLSFNQMGRIGVLLVLAATALFGGLDTVHKGVTTFKTGEEFSDNEFTITIERATLVRELRSGKTLVAPATPGRVYLGVVAKLRNDGTVPGILRNELDLRDIPDKEWIGAMRNADGTQVTQLGPGLTDELAFIWQIPENAVRSGDSVTLRIWQKTFGPLLASYGEDWIYSMTDYGEVVVPVASKP